MALLQRIASSHPPAALHTIQVAACSSIAHGQASLKRPGLLVSRAAGSAVARRLCVTSRKAFLGSSLAQRQDILPQKEHCQTCRAMAWQTGATKEAGTKKTLETLQFDNSFVRELPADPIKENTLRQPTPSSKPVLLGESPEAAALLDLDESEFSRPEFAKIFAGNELLPGMDPYAACYGGHQFGTWARQLGDGRAINLGEVINSRGERWDLQLKGAGRTPYSRMADGRAVVRSSVREFLASEAMAALGIPTTRALCLVGTGDSVMRDQFYDGNARMEPSAIVCRMAPSWVRFGSFEIHLSREDNATLKKLLDYTIEKHFSSAAKKKGADRYQDFFRTVVDSTAYMIAQWQAVGFTHGVMNTDNMSILGLTIDYGPFGFMDDFDYDFVPNASDYTKRYCFGNQATIALWNLTRLGTCLTPFCEVKELQEIVGSFEGKFRAAFAERMRHKLGFRSFKPNEDMEDSYLMSKLYELMALDRTDFTNFFRSLSSVPVESVADADKLLAVVTSHASGLAKRPSAKSSAGTSTVEDVQAAWKEWTIRYVNKVLKEGIANKLTLGLLGGDQERRAAMNRANPKFVLRNHLAQTAIEAIEQRGDTKPLKDLLDLLRSPFDEHPEADPIYTSPPPTWAMAIGVRCLSCSS
eukprot:jgi/Mesvir1/18664/Mv17163-RA.1